MKAFDPDAAASKGSGIFGLNTSREDAKIVLVPVPFAATVSYGGGAENGPEAILAASHQVDLYDWHFGRIYEAGIHLLPADPAILAAHGPDGPREGSDRALRPQHRPGGDRGERLHR
ncbi:MAG TPA: hypothetical protein EYP98_19560 [Planctomycetes bacterium]|nr:hypothetical protein [Planctomycetota bacterium]